jgi:hypothetical protein
MAAKSGRLALPFGMSSSALDNVTDLDEVEVIVNMWAVNIALMVCTHLSAVDSVIKKIVNDVTENGLTVNLSHETDQINLPSLDVNLIELVWEPFVKTLLRALLVVGFAIVGRAPGTNTPYLVDFSLIRVHFKFSARMPRKYWVEELATGRKMRSVRLIIWDEPDNRGIPTSAGVKVVSAARSMMALMQNEELAVHNRANPPWPFIAQPQAPGQPGMWEADQFIQGETAEIWRQHLTMLNTVHMQNMRSTQQLSRATALSQAAAASARGQVISEVAERAEAPYMNSIFVPPGMQIGNPVLPQQNSNLAVEFEYFRSAIIDAFEVPPGIMGGNYQVRHVSTDIDAHAQWHAKVASVRNHFSRNLEALYLFVHKTELEVYCRSFMRVVGEKQKEVKSYMELNEFVSVSKDEENVYVIEDSAILEQTAKKVMGVSDDSLLNCFRSKFKVVVAFAPRPMVRPDKLIPLVQQHVLSLDQFAEMSAMYYGIPTERMLIGQEQRVEEVKQHAELASLTQQDEDKGRINQKQKKTEESKSDDENARKRARTEE